MKLSVHNSVSLLAITGNKGLTDKKRQNLKVFTINESKYSFQTSYGALGPPNPPKLRVDVSQIIQN